MCTTRWLSTRTRTLHIDSRIWRSRASFVDSSWNVTVADFRLRVGDDPQRETPFGRSTRVTPACSRTECGSGWSTRWAFARHDGCFPVARKTHSGQGNLQSQDLRRQENVTDAEMRWVISSYGAGNHVTRRVSARAEFQEGSRLASIRPRGQSKDTGEHAGLK